jgi:hypothetical protein
MDGLTHGKGVHPNFQEPPIYDMTNSLYLNSIPSQSGEIFQDFPTFMPTPLAQNQLGCSGIPVTENGNLDPR